MIDLKDLYAQRIGNRFSLFKTVILPRQTLEAIDEAAEKLAREKLTTDTAYKKDGASLKTRFKTGFKGEAALEMLLGINIMDLSVGFSTNYDHPDIPGYAVGIKTVRYGNFPIIPKHNEYAQIICIVDANLDSKVYVCGIATKEELNLYQNSSLILDDNLKDKGSKTGFYGFHILEPVTKLADINRFKL